jgi:hypothetical protein
MCILQHMSCSTTCAKKPLGFYRVCVDRKPTSYRHLRSASIDRYQCHVAEPPGSTKLQAYNNKQQQHPALYANIVEPDLDKTSLARRHAGNSFYFLMLILHRPSTRQKKLFAATTSKEKARSKHMRRRSQVTSQHAKHIHAIHSLHTAHIPSVYMCVCVARPERKQAAAQ